MELTIDKFGRVLLPKIIRQALGLEPGGKLVLNINEQQKILSLTPVESIEDSEYIVYSKGGWPMLNIPIDWPEVVSTKSLIDATRDEYLDRKAGLI